MEFWKRRQVGCEKNVVLRRPKLLELTKFLTNFFLKKLENWKSSHPAKFLGNLYAKNVAPVRNPNIFSSDVPKNVWFNYFFLKTPQYYLALARFSHF
jgi:hypothetical protein